MGIGRTCAIHNEFCPDGTCRWCEPLAGPPPLKFMGLNVPCDMMPIEAPDMFRAPMLDEAIANDWLGLNDVRRSARLANVDRPNTATEQMLKIRLACALSDRVIAEMNRRMEEAVKTMVRRLAEAEEP